MIPRRHHSAPRRGFALITVLSLLVLLLVVTVGILSLSSISLRGGIYRDAAAVARANARLALTLAIGELQREAGPDQRITASAAILDDQPADPEVAGVGAPAVLGVWDSHREWLNPEGGSRPISATYRKGREPAFRRWLVSSAEPSANSRLAMVAEAPPGGTTMVAARPGSGPVKVPSVPVEDGAYAWWIGGENQKAHAALEEPAMDDPSARVVGRSFAAAGRLDAFEGLGELDAEAMPRVVDFAALQHALEPVPAKESVGQLFHHVTTESAGILANVRRGGLKSDFNLAMELGSLPAAIAGKALRDESPSTLPRPQYPTGINFPSWYKLFQYYRLQNGKADGGGLARSKLLNSPHYWSPGNLNETGYDRTPIVSRAMLMFFAEKSAGSRPNSSSYRIGLNPVLVVWNPYTLKLNCPPVAFRVFPYNLEYKIFKNRVGGEWTKLPTSNRLVSIGSGFSLEAGETRIFSPSGDSSMLEPGFKAPNEGAGFSLPIPELVDVTGTQPVELAIRLHDAPGVDFNGGLFQIYWTMVNAEDQGQRFNELAANPCEPGKPLPIISDKAGERFQLSGMANGSRTSLASFQFVLKTAQDLRNPPPYDQEDLRCKNFVQADPTTNRAMYGTADRAVKQTAQYMVWIQQDTGNALNPDWDPATRRAYFGSGLTAAQGQPLVPLVELSPVPVTSLAALRNFKLGVGRTSWGAGQHNWELAANQSQGFANSFAHPMIPGGSVYANVTAAANPFSGLQFKLISDQWDRALLCNDGLWDDWFCSGIANQAAGPYAGAVKAPQLVSDWLGGSGTLPNSRLNACFNRDGQTTKGIQDRLIRGSGPATNGWKEAARFMMLRGAFNVNSTSVEAWRTFLTAGSGGRFIYQTKNGPAEAEVADGHVLVSRHTVPLSPLEGAGPHDPAAWTGVRYLTPTQLERLARECVHQVKLRGPFLNLSDFINRRLGTGETALCGALQAAIDWDEYHGNSPDPAAADSINGRFKSPGDDYIDTPLSGAAFPAAGRGSRYTGIPGYVTQGDLLARIGNGIAVRDDTFRVRGYGEARDAKGTPVSRAWCEAVVQRVPVYLEDGDLPETPAASLKSTLNRNFGRRLEIRSFRWLAGPADL
jgi:hypothetical protein